MVRERGFCKVGGRLIGPSRLCSSLHRPLFRSDDEYNDVKPEKIGTALSGTIKKVYAENFMCHRKLTIDLIANVNFITGQNGSGKSAILAALQVCLGAGSKVTHRGKNMASFIREGFEGSAIVKVTITNAGEDGYQRDVYGDEIIVERTISRNGTSSYKIMDKEGKIKAKTKTELTLILDHHNIQVENPCAVMDQENAKQFLKGSAKDKFAFFLKATDLKKFQDTVN
jgi:chromosome segregation ATPase